MVKKIVFIEYIKKDTLNKHFNKILYLDESFNDKENKIRIYK